MTAGKKKPEEKNTGTADSKRSLRDDAEVQLARTQKRSADLKGQTPEQLIHELQVHQIELEMQAEELRRAQLALEESRDKFLDLYEFAPLGYLTLNDKAQITDVNLTGAMLLGVDRSELVNHGLGRFIAPADLENWDRYFAKLRQHVKKQVCILMLMQEYGSAFPARLEGVRTTGSDGAIAIRIAINDITDMRDTEDALRMSEEKYRNLFNAESDAIFLIDKKTGSILEVNDAACRLYEYSYEEIIHLRNSDLSAEPDDTQAATNILRDRIPLRYHKKKSGTIFPVEISASRFVLKDREIIVAAIRDITERKQAEEKLVATLKRAQDQQAALGTISFSPHLFSGDVHGLSARLTEVSSGVLGVERASVWLFNNNEDELRCIDLYEVMYDRHSYDGVLKRREYVNEFEALSTAKYIDADDPLTDPRMAGYVKGYLKPNRITSMLDAVIRVSGQNLGVLCFEHVDRQHHWEIDEIAFACQLADQIAITLLNRDRKRAEEALMESEERYRNVVEDQTEFICRFLPGGTHIFVNDAYCRYFNKKREEIIGQQFRPVLHPEDREIVARHLASLTPEHPVRDIDQRIIMPDDSLKWQRWSDRAIFDPNGRVIEYQSVGRDITEQKELEKEMEYHEQELRKYSTSLTVANKKLNLLSSITRHDINNQLTVLQGYLTILKKKESDPTLNEYCSKSATAAQRISAMILFTKQYESIGVNVPAWQDTRTLADTATKQVPLGKIVVKNDLPSGAEIFADPLIGKVFYNLMDNAVRYGGKITTIRFFVEEAGDDHVFICEDDGDGVVAEEKEKIFERGFGKNTGLGLALSREILSITGITIRETGEPGKGARFEMVVPKGACRFQEVQ